MKRFLVSAITFIYCFSLSYAAGLSFQQYKDSLKAVASQYIEKSTVTVDFINHKMDSLECAKCDASSPKRKAFTNEFVVAPDVFVEPSHDNAGLNIVSYSFINNSNKTIKYYSLNVSYRNSVGGSCRDEFGRSLSALKGVGPVAPGECAHGIWDTIYNTTCSVIKINSISLFFTDGTTVSIPASKMLPTNSGEVLQRGYEDAQASMDNLSKKIEYFNMKLTTLNNKVKLLNDFLNNPNLYPLEVVENAINTVDKINISFGIR